MIVRLLPFAATLLARTLRIRWHGVPLPARSVVMFWHGKMFAGWYAVNMRRPVALVSASKDGEILAKVLSRWGYQLTRGSSKKGGRKALDEAIELLKNDKADTIAITPDGPRGPEHTFKRGAFIAARDAGVQLYLLKIVYSRRILLKSWDKFEVPLPFSNVDISVNAINVPESLDDITLQILSRQFAK